MKLSVQFEGQSDPFEGDRTLRLKALPIGAQITGAQITAKPKQAVETITFNGGIGNWGATKEPAKPDYWVAVDLHARRMVSQVTAFIKLGIVPDEVTVQVDIGGVWVRLAADGSIATPDDEQLTLPLSTAPTPQSIPPLVAQRLKLTRSSADSHEVDLKQLTILSYPTNLSLRLGQMPPFWPRPGELTETETSPDFAAVLQTFLAEAEVVDGFYDVPLVIHSDSIARLDVEVKIEYRNQKKVLPEGVTETTLPFDHNSLPQAEADLLQIELPVGARVVPQATTAQVSGAFKKSRVVYGPTGEATSVAAVPVNSGRSQAHPIVLESDLAATAIDLLLAAESRIATLELVLLGDNDGKPSNESLLPEPVTITLDREVAGTPTWISAALPTEFQFLSQDEEDKPKCYWLVLQARDGDAQWSVDVAPAGAVGMQFTADGGLSWRITRATAVTDPLAGFFRLRHTPARYQVPIELQVGNGDQARRVSLDRFQPLGRIDFRLDFDEVAEAINQYLDDAGPAQCPEGEHLANGDFKDWFAVGDKIMRPQFTSLESTPKVVAVAPDGQLIYIGTGSNVLYFIDFACHTLIGEIELSAVVRDITVHPNGTRAYVLAGSGNLHLIGTTNRQQVGNFFGLDSSSRRLALSPDGRRLYVTEYYYTIGFNEGFIRAIDTEALEQAILSGNPNLDDVTINDPIEFGSMEEPTALAVAPDGRRLYVTVIDHTPSPSPSPPIIVIAPPGAPAAAGGKVYIIDTTNTLQNVTGTPISMGQRLRGIALTPDGRKAVVTDGQEKAIYILNTASGAFETVTGAIEYPTAVAISPDGGRAFVVDNMQDNILIIDIARRAVVDSIPMSLDSIGLYLEDIAVRPQGDRVYTISPDSDYPPADTPFLISIPIGAQLPAEWALTSGGIMPTCFSDPFHQVAVLGLSPATGEPESKPTALAQVVPVAASRIYDFNFWGIATEFGAVAEVIWLSEGCGSLRVDEVPVEIFESQEESGSGKLVSPPQIPSELVLHRARLDAPAEATQAEIRFSVPADVLAVIDTVSFKATLETIANSDLQFVQADQLANWVLSPATASEVSLISDDNEAQIQNFGVDPVALVQTVPVTANQPFTLTFQGRTVAAPPTLVSPRIELRWLKSDGTPAGAVTTLSILSTGSDRHTLNGTTPAEAIEVELHLVAPGNTTLAVKQISFQPVELVKVPLTFIAQAPGELTVSDFRVVYDMVAETSLPPVPETGLCAPTPSGRTPGSQPDDPCCCFCPCCETEQPILDCQPTTTSANRPALKGKCSGCDTELVQPGGQPTRASLSTQPLTAHARATRSLTPSSTRLRGSHPSARPAASPVMVTKVLAAKMPVPPLTAIPDIAEAPTERLAAAAPEEVVGALESAPVEIAASITEEAKQSLEPSDIAQTPLVSCIMPTYNRRPFVSQAIKYFLRQDYPHRELIIVDDGTDPIKDLAPNDQRIRYIRLEQRISTGTKKNLACQEANGQIIANWDDDDWMANWRLSYQAASLLQEQADICGLDKLLYYDTVSNQTWQYVYPSGRKPWVGGGTLCYTKAFWSENPFPDLAKRAYIRFLWGERPKHIVILQDVNFYVALIHPGNSRTRHPQPPRWRPYPREEIQNLMGEDWDFYASLFRSSGDRPAATPTETEPTAPADIPATEATAPLLPPVPAELVVPSEISVQEANAMLPITTIKGIGEGRAKQLAKIGIDSMAKLAAASPEQIAESLRGVSVKIATGFIEEARKVSAMPVRKMNTIKGFFNGVN